MDAIEFRAFDKDDFLLCEALVNQAWGIDQYFQSKQLNNIASWLYTQGAFVASNFAQVALCERKVVGFIFCYNVAK